MCELHRYLRDLGIDIVKRAVDASNIASIASAEKNDAEVFDVVLMTTLFGVRRYSSKRGFRYDL